MNSDLGICVLFTVIVIESLSIIILLIICDFLSTKLQKTRLEERDK